MTNGVEVVAGDTVVLQGLSRPDLNGKLAFVLPCATTSERLPVEIKKSKQRLSVKRQNLRRAASDDEGSSEVSTPRPEPTRQRSSGSRSKPCKEESAYLDIPTDVRGSVDCISAGDARSPGSNGDANDSDDSMPPLECTGAVPQKHKVGSVVSKPGIGNTDGANSDDLMSPLEPKGVTLANKVQDRSAQPSGVDHAVSRIANSNTDNNDESDDSMPPLEYVGSAPPAQEKARHHLKVEDNLDASKLEIASADIAADSDDSMPPLEALGTPSKQVQSQHRSTSGDANVAAANVDKAADYDDSMPPLENFGSGSKTQKQERRHQKTNAGDIDDAVGYTPLLKNTSTTTSKQTQRRHCQADVNAPVASKSVVANVENADDSDDSMPPLEYVGVAPTKQEQERHRQKMVSVGTTRPSSAAAPAITAQTSVTLDRADIAVGDAVVLQGLSKAELNGALAIVLPYTSETGRLPVQLKKSKQQLSIKRQNLRLASSEDEAEPNNVSAMSSESRLQRLAGVRRAPQEDTLDPMVRDGHLLKTVDAASAQKTMIPSASNGGDSNDPMPPTVPAGTTPMRQEHGQTLGKSGHGLVDSKVAVGNANDNDDSDDSMPPLECAGISCGKQYQQNFHVNSEAPTVESNKMSASADNAGNKHDSKAHAKFLEKRGNVPTSEDAYVPSTGNDDDSEDSMPPLAYVGIPPTYQEPKKLSQQVGVVSVKSECNASDSDDSMPPLEYVGISPAPLEPKKNSQENGAIPIASRGTVKRACNASDSDDSMPPLEYVGISLAQQESKKISQESGAVPIASRGTVEMACNASDSDDSMPPLEYVGISLAQQESKKNSQESGAVPIASSGTAERARNASDSDDSMPPLEYVGISLAQQEPKKISQESGAVPTASSGTAERACNASDSGDSMPPLEYVGISPAPLEQKKISQESGAVPIVPSGTAKRACNASDSDDSMPPLEYVGISPAPLEPNKISQESGSVPIVPSGTAKRACNASDSDDSMPPLDYVGVNPTKHEHERSRLSAASGDVTSSPSAAAPARTPQPARSTVRDDLAVGDAVVLQGLSKAELNGELALVLRFTSDVPSDRLPVELKKNKQRLSIKRQNLRLASSEDGKEVEDTAPPLDESRGASGKLAPSGDIRTESAGSMRPKEENEIVSTRCGPPSAAYAVTENADNEGASDDSMPPLENVSAVHTDQSQEQCRQKSRVERAGNQALPKTRIPATCSSAQPAQTQSTQSCKSSCGSAVVHEDAILAQLKDRLHQHDLTLEDVPINDHEEVTALLKEIGFESPLVRTKIRKALRNSLASA